MLNPAQPRLACGAEPSCSGRRGCVVVRSSRKGSSQKNEGVYFQYATEHKRESLRPSDDDQFSWVKEARQSHKSLQDNKQRTSTANRPAAPGQRPGSKKQKVPRRQVKQPSSGQGTDGEQSPTRLGAQPGGSSSSSAGVSAGSLAEDLRLLAGLHEGDVAVGTFYDEDDPVDQQLLEIDNSDRLTMEQKARRKMEVLGIYTPAENGDDDDDDYDGSGSGLGNGRRGRSHEITTTTGSIPEGASLQLLNKPARRAS